MLDDLAFAIRRLRQSPRFTVTVVLTLALTVGVNTAIFSVADAILFRALPYERPDEIAILRASDTSTGKRYTLVPYRHVDLIKAHVHDVVGLATLESGPRLTVTSPDGTRGVSAAAASVNYFDVLGVRALRGRTFTPGDLSTGRPVLLTYATWQQSFGGDAHIVGRSITFDQATYDVIGVLPKGFVLPMLRTVAPAVVTLLPPREPAEKGGTFYPIVRLRTGVPRRQVQAEVDALITRERAGDPPGSASVALDEVRDVLYPVGRPVMKLLAVAAALVLLIACMNLGIMNAARARRLEYETAVRIALGASRIRLVGPVVLEALILGVTGGGLGLVVTSLTFDALVRQVPRVAVGLAPIGVDARVVLFSLALGTVGGVLAVALPAWRMARRSVQPLLKRAGAAGGAGRAFGAPALAAQVAMAIVLVFGATIVTRAFMSVLSVPLGFEPGYVAVVRVAPPRGTNAQDFYHRALQAIVGRQDVAAAGAAGSLPLSGEAPNERATSTDTAGRTAGIVHVLPGYFEAAGMSLVSGRLLDEGDIAAGDVAVVAQSAARVLFPGRDPIGGTFTSSSGGLFRVVGVVGDTLGSHERDEAARAYVIPGPQARMLTLVVRTRDRRESTVTALRQAAATMAPGTPVGAAWWADEIAAITAYRNPRFQTLVLVTFAALALVLTGLGIFAVISFAIVSRTREMAIRVAIGASPGSLVALTIRQAVVPVVIGSACGLLATRWFADLARAQLFKVETRDPLILLVSTIVVALAALAAAYAPARRAGRVDPLIVLRE